MGLRSTAKTAIKRALAPWRYPQPSPQLNVERLYLYLDSLYKTRSIPGAIVEVGCFQGGTAAFAHRFLSGIGVKRRYLCIDTFGGFPQDQFAADADLGTEQFLEQSFSANSQKLVRKLLDMWNCPDVELLQADIVQLPADQLPNQVAAALIDVDIAAPTKAALEKIIPCMTPGGIILIDDCDMAGFKGARIATEQVAPQATYQFGMGIVTVQNSASK